MTPSPMTSHPMTSRPVISAPLTRFLERADRITFTLLVGLAAFSAYFAMYAFRKPFSAAVFPAVEGWSLVIDYKIALVIAQVLGYALSKMIGVKIIAEMNPRRRGVSILALVALAWLALLGFALIPAPWNVVCLFLNGLPLGMIYGLVFGYLEGRRVSEVLGAILCASFILSSGVVKSVGAWFINAWDVSPFWMPALTGLAFAPLLLAAVLVLDRVPPPDAADERERVRRRPMDGAERRAFLRAYGPGIAALVFAYLLLTAFRDFRDNFAAEIWAGFGYGRQSAVFAASEVPVAVISLLALGAIMVVRDNLRALILILGLVLAGFALLGLSTLALEAGVISPILNMILSGAGLYMAYTPFNAMLFDRLVAHSGRVATAGFLIYVADATGYLGSVALLLIRNLTRVEVDWVQFYLGSAYLTCVVGVTATFLATIYFWRSGRLVSVSDGPLTDGPLTGGPLTGGPIPEAPVAANSGG